MGFEINSKAMLVKTPVEVRVDDLEAELGRHGFTLGAFQPPAGSNPAFTVADWLADPLIPPCNWAGGTLLDRIVSISAQGKGGRLVTNMAPRSATGPDLNYLVSSTAGALARVREIWLRVHPAPSARGEAVYRFDLLERAAAALASLAHRKAKIEAAHFTSNGSFHTLVLVHDTGTDLGRARAQFADTIVRAAGAATAEAGVSVEPVDPGGRAGLAVRVEALPSGSADVLAECGRARKDGVEVYARYSNLAAIREAGGALERLGSRCGALWRYGTEGFSVLFGFDGKTPPDAARVASDAAAGRGGMVVRCGGAFLTNGGSPVIEGIFRRIGIALDAEG
ncbi:MAG: FAD-binding oxidoreductase [Deltaproteobacteria bacterium]|nr:FAD-binding oxidoreductase [Deltaproteobacteria bacterium]